MNSTSLSFVAKWVNTPSSFKFLFVLKTFSIFKNSLTLLTPIRFKPVFTLMWMLTGFPFKTLTIFSSSVNAETPMETLLLLHHKTYSKLTIPTTKIGVVLLNFLIFFASCTLATPKKSACLIALQTSFAPCPYPSALTIAQTLTLLPT